jgi:hypothetical protein
VIGAGSAPLLFDRVDLAGEVVDQIQTRVDGLAPRLRELEALQELASGDPEQVRDRARVPEAHQRRVDPVLEHRLVLDQMQPEARLLTLTADPDLRHQIAVREDSQHPRVDPVGLARQRREPFHLLGMSDPDIPPQTAQACHARTAPRSSTRTAARTGSPWLRATFPVK